MAAYGREPDDIKIMPGVSPVLADTETEAREKHEELQELISDATRSTGRCPNCRRARV